MPDLSTEDGIFALDGNVAVPSVHAAGPWDPRAQHGSAPASLIAYVVSQIPSAAPMQLARLTLDLMRPVPIAPLTIDTQMVRDGKKIQVVTVTLLADGTPCVRASALRIRAADTLLPDVTKGPPLGLPMPEASTPSVGRPMHPGFVDNLDRRIARGGGPMTAEGPSSVWFRLNRPIVTGVPILPVMRAAVAADFPNGISSVLPFQDWMFINGDLSFNLAREPVGEWVLCEATTTYGPNGCAIAHAALADAHGWIGRSVQSLVVEKR